ncbi:hypothetical protein HPB52_024184 [Rhipicephalus sanguineus]|uniref:Uncharacterized protein n=1 Tax=Rhipicephalus sanguineus TaxID=34632 RepID=A0A9D4PT24_RHISA|nr:hypothetical protein HPB52_024184 [Rhipicephalus sanguineus]
MTGDARLKKKTRQAYGKKQRRPWNAPQKKADNVRVRPSSPDAAEVMHSDDGAQPRAPVVSETVHSPGLSCSTSSDCYVVGSSGTSSNVQDRIDTTFYSVDESAQCARNAASLKASLASQCATERKFKLLDVDLEDDGKENGTEFCIIDLAVIDSLLRLFACPECGMQRAVLATLKHMSCTDEAPKHDLCPEGPDSWCKYQRAVAKNEKPPPHKERLPDFVSEALEPVFRRLSDGALLERCSDGITQNPSESLHSVIWQQAPKIQHASLRSIERAVAEAVSRFNQGVTKSNVEIAEKLGYSAGYNLVRCSLEKDKTRLQKSQREHLDSNTAKTRLAQRHKPARDPAYSPDLL